MNWTGGRLQQSKRSQRRGLTPQQKAYFCRAKAKRCQGHFRPEEYKTVAENERRTAASSCTILKLETGKRSGSRVSEKHLPNRGSIDEHRHKHARYGRNELPDLKLTRSHLLRQPQWLDLGDQQQLLCKTSGRKHKQKPRSKVSKDKGHPKPSKESPDLTTSDSTELSSESDEDGPELGQRSVQSQSQEQSTGSHAPYLDHRQRDLANQRSSIRSRSDSVLGRP